MSNWKCPGGRRGYIKKGGFKTGEGGEVGGERVVMHHLSNPL